MKKERRKKSDSVEARRPRVPRIYFHVVRRRVEQYFIRYALSVPAGNGKYTGDDRNELRLYIISVFNIYYIFFFDFWNSMIICLICLICLVCVCVWIKIEIKPAFAGRFRFNLFGVSPWFSYLLRCIVNLWLGCCYFVFFFGCGTDTPKLFYLLFN